MNDEAQHFVVLQKIIIKDLKYPSCIIVTAHNNLNFKMGWADTKRER